MKKVLTLFFFALHFCVLEKHLCAGEQATIFNGVYLNELGHVLTPGEYEHKARYSIAEKAVFLAAHGENLEWAQAASEKFGIYFVIYQSKDSLVPNFVPNVGSEACKYAKIFSDHYEYFPRDAILLHGHEVGNHNGPHRNMSQVEVIETWLREGRNERWKSAPSPRTYHVKMRPLEKHVPLLEIIAQSPQSFGEDPRVSKVVATSADYKTSKILWKDTYPKKWPYITLPAEYYTARNAQFSTTSEAVKNHPKKVWDFAYKICINHLTATGIRRTKRKLKKKRNKNVGVHPWDRPGYNIGCQFESCWKQLLAPGCDPQESYSCP